MSGPERLWAEMQPYDFSGYSPCWVWHHSESLEDGSDGAVEYVRADLCQAPAPSWQPIETAPRDGRIVLLYSTETQNGLRTSVTPSYFDEEFGWCGRSSNDEAILAKVKPTHWMPLPAPPAQKGGE